MIGIYRITSLSIGLIFFVVIGILDVIMAMAATSIKPLAILWVFVPTPFVFLVFALHTPKKQIMRQAGFAYLVVSASLTIVVLFIVAWIGSERAIHPKEHEELPKLSEFPYLKDRIEEIRFKSRDGTSLSGWFIPNKNKATILLLHGYDQRREQMLPHADMLYRAGFSIFLFDFRSRGRSKGDAVTLGYYERGDVLGAIDYLKTRADVASTGFGVLGLSQGGATAILTAAITQEIKAVAVEGVFRNLASAIDQGFEHFINLPAFPFAPLTIWIAEQRTKVRSEEIAPERKVMLISPRPILIMHGELDTIISPKDSQVIYLAAHQPKELWLIPGCKHAEGAKKAKEEYERRITTFFKTYLKITAR